MNQKGSVLLGVLLIIGFTLLIGVPVLQAANLEHQAAVNSQLDAQAFYLAEAGIQHCKQAALQLLQSLVADGWLPEQGGLESPFVTVSRENYGPGDYEASAFFQDNGDGTYSVRIESTGIVGGAVGLAKGTQLTFPLIIDEGGSGPGGPGGGGTLIDMALFASESIKLDSAPQIHGDVVTNATGSDRVYFANTTVRILGSLHIGKEGNPDTVIVWPWGVEHSTIVTGGEPQPQVDNRSFPAVEFPIFPGNLPPRNDINLDNPNPLSATISADGYYNSVRLNGNSSTPAILTIDAPSGTTRTLRIKWLEFNNTASLVINGTGKVMLYVDNSITFRNQLTVNAEGSAEQLVVYCAGNAVQFTNDSVFNGNLICQSADVNINSNSRIIGNLLTASGDVAISRNGQREHNALIYAPIGRVAMNSGSVVDGAIICRDFYMTNNCVLRYNASVKHTFGGGGGGIDFGDAVWAPTR